MALIGDIVIAARELIPDMPDVVPQPTAVYVVVAATGSTLPAGTYYAVTSLVNPWGETLASAESSALTVGANQGIQVTCAFPPGVTKMRVYLTTTGGAAGTESQFIDGAASPFTIAVPPTTSGTPPSRGTAWLPDDDGGFLSAGTLYRWLNEGIQRAAQMLGGILDYTGVASVQGQALYTLTGQWKQITSIWYDGFPLDLGNREYFFRRNSIQSSVLASATVSVQDDRSIIEVFYQPVRTAGATVLSSAMAAGDTTASITSTAGFLSLAPPMMAQIGAEIVAFYNFTGTSLQGLIRGLGGTSAQAWASGTAVTELNMPISGRRLMTVQYGPGDSGTVLNVPVGWSAMLPEYLLYKARLAEQMDAEAAGHLKSFSSAIEEWGRGNRQIAGPRSVSIYPRGAEVVPGFGTPLGGVVLP